MFRTVVTFVTFIFLARAGATAPAGLPEVWEKDSKLLFNEANSDVEKLQAKPGGRDNRELKYAEAVTLLNVQPKTGGNVDRAQSIFEKLAGNDFTDDLAMSSRYYLARIEQFHRTEANRPKAISIYREMWKQNSSNLWSQQGAVKLAIVLLFQRSTPVEKKEAFRELEKMVPGMVNPLARKDFHLVLAKACLDLGGSEEKALNHYLAADEVGLSRLYIRGDHYIRIAELARRQGKNDLALKYYRLFLNDYKRDARIYQVQEIVARMEKGTSKP